LRGGAFCHKYGFAVIRPRPNRRSMRLGCCGSNTRYACTMDFIHDSLLTGYNVDGTNRTIVLRTEPHQGGGSALIDVIFNGVVAYHFEGDCFGNIVFDIEEVSPASIISDGKAFEERNRAHGWPPGWNPEKEGAQEFFSRVGCRLYEIHCSYGMYGWIAAKEMQQLVHRE
jgi:hypothetical protein